MPRYWGSWTATSSTGARYRLGMDWSRSGTRVTVDQYLFESAFSIHKDITLTRTGRLSGTYSVAVSTSGGVVSLGRGASVTGSRGGSVTIGGRATNVLHGLVPSFSHTISIPAVAPSAPGRPSVSNITHNSVRMSWSAPSNNGGASVVEYQIQIARNSSFSGANTHSNGSSRTRTQPLGDANQAFWVRVRARNSAGWSSWSSSRSFTSLPLRPNAPTGVDWDRNNDSAYTVSWSHSATSARPVDRFRVQRQVYDVSGWSNWVTRATVPSSTRSYQDSVHTNRAFRWRVRAEGPGGTATSSATGNAYPRPGAPSGVSARAASGGIRVSFTDNVQYGSHEHQIQHRAGGGSWATVAVLPGSLADHHQTKVWTHSNPDLSVTHEYRVRSQNTAGPMHVSDWVYSNTVQLAAPPAAPTGLGPSTVWDASEDRTLTWRHVPTDGSEQERFQVRHRLQGDSWTTVSAVASGSEQWTLPGGTYEPGDTIEWQVRTMGVHPDWGPWSASNFQQPTSRPTVAINAPEDGSEIDTSSVLVTWGYAGPEQDDGDEGEVSGQAAWRLTVLRGSNVVTEESGSDDRDEFLVRGLSDDATYTIRVEVRSGEGLWSAEPDEVTFPVSYLPPAPPQIGVAFDRDLGAAVVDVQTAPPHEPYEYVNVVTNPRGRPADTGVDADPLVARQALLDALAAYTDAPAQWSATEPGDTSVVWVDPGTGVARQWSAGVGGSVDDVVTRRNLVTNPRGRNTDGTVIVVENYEGDESPDPDLELVDGNLAAPRPVDWSGTNGVLYYSARHDSFALHRTSGSNMHASRADNNWPNPLGILVDLWSETNDTFRARGYVAGMDLSYTTITSGAGVVRNAGGRSGVTMLAPNINADDLSPGDVIYWRTRVTEGTSEPSTFFDGDTPDTVIDGVLHRYAWEDTPHASPSTETALGRGWHDITDPGVVAAGQEYADAVAALAPVGWDGTGLWWSAEHDAVYVPQGTEATVPTADLPETVTLVLLDAETGESAQYWDHTSATIPADTVGRYLRAAIVEGGMFTGPYFDGDYPRGPGQDGSLATYRWDGEPHDSATTATITSLETESVQLWRAIDDGPWLLIADGVPPDTAISDPIPAIGDRRVNHYRATSVSAIGSAMHSDEHELTVPTHGPGGNHGWVYVNGGPDFSDMIRVRANATRSGSQGLAKGVRRYAGNPRAQERSGTAEHRTWSIGVNAREQLYEDGASRPEDIDRLQRTGGVICYRDPLGARWFASMGMMDDSYQGITGEVSWPMEEVDQPEGLATEARDQSHGDEDDDPGEDVPE